MKKKTEETAKRMKEKLQASKRSAIAVSLGMLALGSIAFADPSIATMVNNAVNLVFGLVAFGGIVNIVRGAATVAKGLQDDGGGQDAAAISKGRGQLLAGAVMVAPTALITLITQQSPGALISTYFS
ncbi:MAG: hypothetical protein IJV04_05290 [Lachnospiraceae bacterium]|nr:hypothetical protein [Lachnospiraceae bacterium]